MLLGWGTIFRELKVLSRCWFFLWIGTLSVDFPLWTARAGGAQRGQLLFQGILDLHCVLAGYLSSRVDKVLCSGSKVLCSVPKSYVQVAKSYMINSKVLCSVPKFHAQFQCLMISSKVLWSGSKVLWSVPKSYVQLHSFMFSSKVLCSGSKV